VNSRVALLAAGGRPWRQALKALTPGRRSPGADADTAFDRLARSLAEELPRREALRRLGGGLAVALLASLGSVTAWGDPKTLKCKHGTFPCPPNLCCPNGDTCCGTHCCPAGRVCCVGKCCLPGYYCVDGHCSVCPAGQGLCNGSCCDLGRTCCGDGTCADTQNDPSHCGSCTQACNPNETCSGGTCHCGSGSGCGSGFICASAGTCCMPAGATIDATHPGPCCGAAACNVDGCVCVCLGTGSDCSVDEGCCSGSCIGGVCA
jgi:hypothetical protein